MVRYVLIGAGNRGKDAYGRWIARNGAKARLMAVSEPREARREECGRAHGIHARMLFPDWREMLARERFADACIVATQDRDHVAPALAAMAAGYHVLLEKPMAITEADCRRLAEAAEKADVSLEVCYVLRHTRFFAAIKAAIDGGMCGAVAAIRHSENVSYWHYAHSFVRGAWRNEAGSSPLILAKSCHDMDILCWLAGGTPRAVQSFGSQGYFVPANAPAGAPARCTDGCPHEAGCPWSAPRLYIHGSPILSTIALSCSPVIRPLARLLSAAPLDRLVDWRGEPASDISEDHSRAARWEALATGPYGRCVFRCDNDVVDRQVVNILFDNGIVADFTLHGHSHFEGRQIRVDGSAGSIEGVFGFARQEVAFYDHRRGGRRILWRDGNPFSGHGGGDDGLMEAFTARVEAARGGSLSPTRKEPAGATPAAAEPGTAGGSGRAALLSHLICFAAERSRREGRVVEIRE